MTFSELLVWLAGGGSLLLISWLTEYYGWFSSYDSKKKQLIFVGISGAIMLASMAVNNFVPVEIIQMLDPYITGLIGLVGLVFLGEGFHKVNKI